MLCKKGMIKNFSKFTGKHLCLILFFNKVASWGQQLYEKRLWHRCFPVNFAKFLRTHFLKNISVGCFCYLRTILAHLATISECIAARSSSIVTKSDEFLNVNNDYYSPSLCTSIDWLCILGYYSNILIWRSLDHLFL